MGRVIAVPRWMVVALGLTLAVALVASASGKSKKPTGGFTGDDNATVSMKVKLSKKGKPKQVKKFEYGNVDTACEDPDTGGLQPGPERSGSIPGKMKATKSGSGSSRTFGKTVDDDKGFQEVDGTVNKKGKKASGALTLQFAHGDGLECTAEVQFTAKKGG